MRFRSPGSFVKTLKCSNPNIVIGEIPAIKTVAIRESPYVHREYAFELSVKEDAPPGVSRGFITCCTVSSPDGDVSSRIPVDIQIAGSINARPGTLFAKTEATAETLPSWYVTISGATIKNSRNKISVQTTADWLSAFNADTSKNTDDSMRIFVEVLKRPDEQQKNAGVNIICDDVILLFIPVYLSTE